MTNYSIEKIGSDYVVKVDDQSVIKVGSRRRAAQLVVEASELLDEAPQAHPLAPIAVPADGETAAGETAGEGTGLSQDALA
jgi:hypothetical protein